MTGFSQPERRALARSQATQPHPDADLLNAFSEQMLTTPEREQVLAHLAVCAECRDVVALATPPIAAQVTEPAQAASRWRWPVLRWGAVAASAVVVVIAISLGKYERPTAPKMAQYTTETAPAAASTAHQPAGKPGEEAPSAGMRAPQVRYEKVAPKSEQLTARADAAAKSANQKKEASPIVGSAMGGAVNAPAMSPQDRFQVKKDEAVVTNKAAAQSETSARMQAPPPPPPSAPVTVTKSYEPLVASESVQGTGNAGNVEPAPSPTSSEVIPERKHYDALHKATPSGGPMPASRALPMNAPDQKWQVSPEGSLLSSLDHGKNWVRQLPDLRFTLVQTVGTHVWACGPDGVLMHSTDSGISWSKVIPKDENATLQGDITSIVFIDVNQGVLETSKGQRWTTSDAGQSWKKR